MNVPIPDLPAHVALAWTPTRAACVVTCDRCRGGTALYTPLLLRDPTALTRAVDDHRRCP